MVRSLQKPRNLTEALSMLEKTPGAHPLAGGTYILTSQFKSVALDLVSIEGLLPSAILRSGSRLTIGAAATFQDLVDSSSVPEVLREAARGMADRNIRNRATVGGNIGAAKSCSSLGPLFIALGAEFSIAGGARQGAEAWFSASTDTGKRATIKIIESIELSMDPDTRTAYARWSRTSCDVAVLTVSVAYALHGGMVRNLRIALGGLGPRPRRFAELEKLFEGKPLPTRETIEVAAAPHIEAINDLRGGAEFKRYRAAALLSDAIVNAEAMR